MSAARRELLRQVTKIRRRAGLVLALEQASAASICALTMVAVVTMAWGKILPWSQMIAVAALLTAALAMALTLLRWPSLASIARLLDRRLRLDERVETAVELADRRDEVNLLIQDDALRHLDGVDARAIIPWRWRGSVAVAASALAIIALGALTLDWLAAPAGERRAQATRSRAGSRETPQPRTADPEAPTPSSDPSVTPRGPAGGRAEPSPAAPRAASAAVPEGSPAGRAKMSVPPSSAEEPSDVGSAARAPTAHPLDGGGRTEPPSTPPGDQESVSLEITAANSGLNTGRKSPAVDGAAGAEPGAGGATGGAGALVEGSGLQLARSTSVPRKDGEMEPGDLEPRLQLGASPELVSALERLPPGMERHVRNYLRAIRRPR